MAGETILLVDDTRLNRELAKDVLELAGYHVIEAEDGKEALEFARADTPDMILLDIELPDMSGFEVIGQLKGDPLTRDIAVVALTAHSKPDDETLFFNAGFAGYISKPINIKGFAQTVAEFMK
ncbi:MAG: response regulator [Deltaproteobacteria bacterium]|nr:response regulator [Deltaproteobacteria bacterium]